MDGDMKKKREIALGVIGLILLCCLAFSYIKKSNISRQVPTKIGIQRTIHSEHHQACVFGLYEMGDATARAIKQQGLEFFKDATMAEGFSKPVYYQAWKKTPIPPDELDEGRIPSGFQCIRGIDDKTYAYIHRAAIEAGAYYVSRGNNTILVIPENKMIVYSKFD
ncbi:hypothetical protein [Sphingopyxis sp. GC21]|uniref:hypothetical protein n=1 Tax=Sphingopyxis sp. GC21 TaxID=2933562 RepID=UPI0021E50C08|nr:hypothetical protein [Sphingopyxis sp. GC21]